MRFFKWLACLFPLVMVFHAATANAEETPAAGKDQLLIINKAVNRMAFFEQGKLIYTYEVGTGRKASYTPEGKFRIVNKIKNRPYYKMKIPGGDPANPLGDRWMGIGVPGTSGQTYGIHGNNDEDSVGKYVSSGCIRMHNSEIRKLFKRIALKTPVYIVHSKKSFEDLAADYGYRRIENRTVPANIDIDLHKSVPLYHRPYAGSQLSAGLSAQRVRMIGQAEGWLHVETWLGAKWILLRMPDFSIAVTRADAKLDLKTTSPLYADPLQRNKPATVLAPQTVHMIGKSGGWYVIETWKGPLWMEGSRLTK